MLLSGSVLVVTIPPPPPLPPHPSKLYKSPSVRVPSMGFRLWTFDYGLLRVGSGWGVVRLWVTTRKLPASQQEKEKNGFICLLANGNISIELTQTFLTNQQ